MWIFTTREIAIFIYAIILLGYVLIRKKGKSIFLPIIKAAFHIKLIVPFLFLVSFSGIFVWLCSYLSFWNWSYFKDVIFWTLFAGVPVCFNATSITLEEHYFKRILTNNFKFAALSEFITGTFTFHIVVELLLQPVLVVFIILQLTVEKNQNNKAKKLIDVTVAVTGFLILILTVKSIIDAVGYLQSIDLAISFVLPIILSILYLPIAYFFAVYAKYELLFIRMSFKEPNDKKIKFSHRIKIIRMCKLSYNKVCKFLYEYLPKMYVKMGDQEFNDIIDEFRGTTEHTYIAVIKHNGQYYVSRQLVANSKFKFNSYTVNKGGLFKSSNKALRKEIALQIQKESSFCNTDYNNENIHAAVYLRKIFLFNKGAFFKRAKIAIFLSSELKSEEKFISLPYDKSVKNQSDDKAIKLMQVLKWDIYWAPFLMSFICLVLFIFLAFDFKEWDTNLDLFAFLYASINQIRNITKDKNVLFKSKLGRRIMPLKNSLTSYGIWEGLIVFFSLFVAHIVSELHLIDISSSVLSKLCIALIFSGVLIDIWTIEQ